MGLVCLSGCTDIGGGGGIPKAESLGPIRISHPTLGFGCKYRDTAPKETGLLGRWALPPFMLLASQIFMTQTESVLHPEDLAPFLSCVYHTH